MSCVFLVLAFVFVLHQPVIAGLHTSGDSENSVQAHSLRHKGKVGPKKTQKKE